MRTIWGTANFVSKQAAIRYYRPYCDDYAAVVELVEDKLRRGEIFIGKPEICPGERLITIDGGKRYALEAYD